MADGFPLHMEAEKVVDKKVDFNAGLLPIIFTKVEWKAAEAKTIDKFFDNVRPWSSIALREKLDCERILEIL